MGITRAGYNSAASYKASKIRGNLGKRIKKHWMLYVFLFLPFLYIVVFKYIPMYGVQIAFRDFNPARGFMASPWIGLKHFENFFNSYQFGRLLKNTIGISVYSIAASFPLPIILAVALNEARSRIYSKAVQMLTYAPYFISTVILCSIVTLFFSTRTGFINNVIAAMGMEEINFLGEARFFKSIFVWSGIWRTTGYSAVIYIAALSGVNQNLYEASKIDGATTFQKVIHIDLPSIMPTAMIILILSCAGILNVGHEKVLLLQNPLNMEASDVISTYVYRMGIKSAQYSYSSAIGLFNSVVSFALLIIVNKIAKRATDVGLW